MVLTSVGIRISFRVLGFGGSFRGFFTVSVARSNALSNWPSNFTFPVAFRAFVWNPSKQKHNIKIIETAILAHQAYYKLILGCLAILECFIWALKTFPIRWRSRFARTFNFEYENSTGTQFSRQGYKSQLVAALIFNRAIRYTFEIKVGEGNIRNVDESMCYTYNIASKSWTVWVLWVSNFFSLLVNSLCEINF